MKKKLQVIRRKSSDKVCYNCSGFGAMKNQKCERCGGTGVFKDNHYILIANGIAFPMDTIK